MKILLFPVDDEAPANNPAEPESQEVTIKKPKRRRRDQTETIKFLSTEQVAALFRVIKKPRDKAIFVVAYRHGLRASELGLLQVSDVDFAANSIHVHRLKRSRGGVFPMQPDESRLLKAWIKQKKDPGPRIFVSQKGSPISRFRLAALMVRYGALAGLPRELCHFHALKHSIATHLLSVTHDIRFIQNWLGHLEIGNTTIYAALVPGYTEGQARTAFGQLPKF